MVNNEEAKESFYTLLRKYQERLGIDPSIFNKTSVLNPVDNSLSGYNCGLPGAIERGLVQTLWFSFHARACSLPPDPNKSMRMSYQKLDFNHLWSPIKIAFKTFWVAKFLYFEWLYLEIVDCKLKMQVWW